jgi:hypothetical protein
VKTQLKIFGGIKEKTMLIYKKELPVNTEEVGYIYLPAAEVKEAVDCILKTELQHGEPYVWYDVVSEDAALTKYLIIAVGTGHFWGDTLSRDQYIGTVQLYGGVLVLHYFLVKSDDNKKNDEGEINE